MRAARWLGFVLAVVGSSCGDNNVLATDAAPDTGGNGDPPCSDGIDNDGDGLTDYPLDPGCIAPQAQDETDDCPSGPGCPQCANDLDDDGNGLIDYPNDPGCQYAGDNTEFVNDPFACGSTLMIKNLPATGMDTGTLDVATSSVQFATPCSGVGVAGIAYRLNIAMPTVLVANTSGSTADTVLDLRGADCDDGAAEITCHNDVSSSNRSSAITRSLAPGNYFLIVAGADTAATGAYTLQVEQFAGEGSACTDTAMCGPGLVCRTPLGAPGMVCAKPQCADTLDDDGDTKNGYPDDPGCQSLTDNDETDDCPSGPNCPACGNGMDDDVDGQTDYPNDTACNAASGASEACNGEADPIVNITSPLTQGTLVGTADNHNPSCGGDGGGDLLFTLKVPPMRTITIDTENSQAIDTVLSLLDSTCAEPSIECDDDDGASPTLSSLITRTNLPAGTYIVAVDNYNNVKPPGPIDLNVDGIIAPGGACNPDDTLGGALACPVGNPCEGATGAMRCRPNACADGMDNDADGNMDYPSDPGCASADDNDETDTCPGVGAGCPECSDGSDNDGDGATDSADSNCPTPSSPSEGCTSTDGVTALVTASTASTTVGATNDTPAACGTSATQTSPDKMFSLELPAMRTVTIGNSNSFDAVVTLLNSSCGGAPITCQDEPEDIVRDNVPAGTYYYSVDGDGANVTGSFTVNISGTIQSGGSCESPLAQAGAITCPNGFTCKGNPGARTCQRAACADGADNDGDFIADYPNDPGCTSMLDDDESDACPGAGCPACRDGLDNDGDGFVDYPDDPTCPSASFNSETCMSTETAVPLVAPLTMDTTVGATHDVTLACAGTSSGTAPDKIYELSLPDLATLSITNTNSFDAVVGLYGSSCGPTPLQCGDEPENLTFTNLAGGTYYYLVDGDGGPTVTGDYMIGITGTIKPGQSCESALALSGALTCTFGYMCEGTVGSRTCQPTACNDGMDNDADGRADYPLDPGCVDRADDDEMDAGCPGAMGCPACADGTDNDGDAQTDYPNDTSCIAASSDNEACRSTEGVPDLTLKVTADTTVGATNDVTPSCGSSSNTAGDRTYKLTVPALKSLTIANTNSFDQTVSLRDSTCGTGAAQLVCQDEPETITRTNVAAGTYYYIVDGYSSATGAYTITLDGVIANGNSCESPLIATGAIHCENGYACQGAAGSRTCQVAACADGMDNDGDGVTDFPDEPGCESANDADETNPATAAVCSNSLDDDSDTLTDYPADYGCEGAGSTSEVFCAPELNPTRLINMKPITGTTSGGTNEFASQTCQSNASGKDLAFALQLPVPVASLVIDLSNSTFDSVLSVRNLTCSDSIACDDDSGSGNTSMLTLTNVARGTYAVIVDGYSGGEGNYTLNVTGTVASGTSCTSPLFAAGVLVCPTGTTCTGSPSTCSP